MKLHKKRMLQGSFVIEVTRTVRFIGQEGNLFISLLFIFTYMLHVQLHILHVQVSLKGCAGYRWESDVKNAQALARK